MEKMVLTDLMEQMVNVALTRLSRVNMTGLLTALQGQMVLTEIAVAMEFKSLIYIFMAEKLPLLAATVEMVAMAAMVAMAVPTITHILVPITGGVMAETAEVQEMVEKVV